MVLVCECYVFLQQMLNSFIDPVKNGKRMVRKTPLDADLWLDGKQVGQLKARFEIEHEQYLEQEIAGVMTEDGLQKAAPLVFSGSKISKNPKLTDLAQLFNTFQTLIRQRQRERSQSLKKDMERTEKEVKATVDKISAILGASEKKSSTSFIYNDIMELVKAQALFLDVAELLWTTYDRMEPFMDPNYYGCLEKLLKRGEFDLANITLQSATRAADRELKVDIAFRYQKLLYDILNRVFDDLENKGLSSHQRKFIEVFLAYGYFRISDFRKQLLAALSDGRYLENTARTDMIKQVLFNWQEEFYKLLPADDQRLATNRLVLEGALAKNWTQKFRSRGIIFFYFLREWCEYVRKMLVVSEIVWETIPGYQLLVDNFLEQMRAREINKYPEILLESSLALLHNAHQLKTFVFTVLEKTK